MFTNGISLLVFDRPVDDTVVCAVFRSDSCFFELRICGCLVFIALFRLGLYLDVYVLFGRIVSVHSPL